MNKLLLFFVALLLSSPALAQNGTFQGQCYLPGEKIVTQGMNSTTLSISTYPRCRVDVYLSGTTIPANIFSTSTGTALSNPFTANTDASWLFWAANNVAYDVKMTGGSPYVMPATKILVHLENGGSGGGGGLCGPLQSDATSTNCGNGNQTASTATTVSTFGFENVTAPISGSAIVVEGNDNFGGTGAISGSAIGAFGNANIASDNAQNFDSFFVVGNANALNVTSGNSVIGGGNGSMNFIGMTSATLRDVIAFGDGSVTNTNLTGDVSLQDVIGIGNEAAGQVSGSIQDVIGIGDGVLSILGDGIESIVGIGNGAVSTIGDNVDDVVGMGDGAAFSIGHDSSEIVGIGTSAASLVGANSDNIVAIGVTGYGLGPNSSDVINIGRQVDNYAGATLTNAINIGIGQNTASFQIKLGDPTITQAIIFGTPQFPALLSAPCVGTDASGNLVNNPGCSGGGGFTYPTGTGIVQVTSGSAWGTTLGLQGTDSNVLSAGTISGTGVTLCTDANGGATTSGCSGGGITALTGDGTASGSGSVAFTLATVNSGPGACGDATHVCQVTTNAKGLVTAQTAVAITAGGSVGSVSNSDGTLTISPTTGSVVASLNLAQANSWSGQQTFIAPILGTPASVTLTNGTGLSLSGGTAGTLPLNRLAAQAVNTVIGAVTATNPSALSMTDCHGATNGVTWTNGAGFGCNTFSNTGNTTSTALTTGVIPLANGANSIVDSHLSDTGSQLIYSGTGSNHGVTMGEGGTIAGVSGSDVLYTNSSLHRWMQNPNNIGALMIPGVGASIAAGNVWVAAANGIDMVDGGPQFPVAAQTIVNCATSGTVTFSQPSSNSSYKVVMAYAASCLGAAAYTYPTAFSHTPQVLSQSLSGIMSATTTIATVTGTTSTGFIELNGY